MAFHTKKPIKKPVFFARNTVGATAVEFGLIAPVLFLLLIGMIEFGMILFTTSVLEGATNISARTGKTGFTASGFSSREAFIRNQLITKTGGFLDPSRLTITILSYDSFDNIGKPEPCISPPSPPCPGAPGVNFLDINGNGIWDKDQGASSAGGGGAVVLYRVNYAWQLFTPLMSKLMGQGGIYNITAVATVRNEPF